MPRPTEAEKARARERRHEIALAIIGNLSPSAVWTRDRAEQVAVMARIIDETTCAGAAQHHDGLDEEAARRMPEFRRDNWAPPGNALTD